MLTFTEVQNQFISLFGQTARYHHRYKVFSDFVQCGAIAVHNRFCPDEELEQQYMTIIKVMSVRMSSVWHIYLPWYE